MSTNSNTTVTANTAIKEGKNTMTNAKKAKRYASIQTTPIQEKCPIIVQKSKKKKGYYYWYSHTGEVKIFQQAKPYGWDGDLSEKEKTRSFYNAAIVPNTKVGYNAIYANYIPQYNCVEIAMVHMPGNVGKENEPRNWEYDTTWNTYYCRNTRLFMFKGDKHLYTQNGEIWKPGSEGKFYNAKFKNFANELNRNMRAKVTCEEFANYIGDATLAHRYQWPYMWDEYYKKMAPRPTSKAQATITEITKLPLTAIKELNEKYPINYTIETKYYYGGQPFEEYHFDTKDILYFEIINDDYCVIRCLKREFLNGWQTMDRKAHLDTALSEPYRIYIDTKGKVTVVELIDGNYRITSRQVRNLFCYWDRVKFVNFDEISKWKRLSWINDILISERTKESDDNTRIDQNLIAALVSLLRHPILEKVYKAGYKEIYKELKIDNAVARNLQEYFGVKEKSKGDLNQLLGVNKYALSWLEKALKQYTSENRYDYQMRNLRNCAKLSLSCAKEIYGAETVAKWNEETVNQTLKAISTLISEDRGYRWKHVLDLEGWGYYYHRDENAPLTDEQRANFQKVLRHVNKNNDYLDTLLDTIQSYRRLDDEHKIDITNIFSCDDMSELRRYHDAATNQYTLQEQERRRMWALSEQERLAEQQKKYDKKVLEEKISMFEYSNDEDSYMIVVPRLLSEISNEGVALHHCVAGYVGNHASGNTSIIFLRRKEAPTTPFFTIEVRDNHVVQIHGACNKWLGTSPEAIPFVIKWLKEKGIHCKKAILLDTSTGYGSYGHYLDGTTYGLTTDL